jgi:hypothetical protein
MSEDLQDRFKAFDNQLAFAINAGQIKTDTSFAAIFFLDHSTHLLKFWDQVAAMREFQSKHFLCILPHCSPRLVGVQRGGVHSEIAATLL